jgi:hypothetical protein
MKHMSCHKPQAAALEQICYITSRGPGREKFPQEPGRDLIFLRFALSAHRSEGRLTPAPLTENENQSQY